MAALCIHNLWDIYLYTKITGCNLSQSRSSETAHSCLQGDKKSVFVPSCVKSEREREKARENERMML